MKCYICDREDDLITYDRVRHEYGPCTVCQAIIQETLAEFEEPEAEDDFEVDNSTSRSDDRSYGTGFQLVSPIYRLPE